MEVIFPVALSHPIKESQDLTAQAADPKPKHATGWSPIKAMYFETVGTKTCQILLDGYYYGILKPDAHYLSLNKDFSNIQDVLERFRDRHFVQKLVDDTYEYVMEWHTYDHRILDVWNAVSK